MRHGPEYAPYAAGGAFRSVDLDTWENKTPTRKDVNDYIRVLEVLPNVDMQACLQYVNMQDVPDCMAIIEINAAKLRLSTKAQWEGAMLDNYKFNIELGKITGNEIMKLGNPIAPLAVMRDGIANMKYYIQHDIPFSICNGTLMGTSGPATIAGSVATDNACSLATIAMAQLLKPGTRTWIGSMLMVQNMKTGNPTFGDIGNILAEAAFNQMWRYYKIPCFGNSSAWTNSKAIDYQTGYEMSMALMSQILTGANCINFYGSLHAELTAHPVKAILDDDVVAMAKRYIEGIEVSEQTIPLDIIDEVGPMPGCYLGTKHTRDWWKKECYVPNYADRLSYDTWEKTGKKKAIDIAKERMDEILSEYKVIPLPQSQDKEVEDILNEARTYYKKKSLITDEEWKKYQEDINSDEYTYSRGGN